MKEVGEAIIEQDNGDIFCYKGTTPGHKGVGLIIRNSVKYMVHEITAVSERIISLILTAKRFKFTIIQTYTPATSSSEQELEDFYDLLEFTVEKYQSPKTIIVRDFNSKVGYRSRGEEETLRPHGYGARN